MAVVGSKLPGRNRAIYSITDPPAAAATADGEAERLGRLRIDDCHQLPGSHARESEHRSKITGAFIIWSPLLFRSPDRRRRRRPRAGQMEDERDASLSPRRGRRWPG